METPKDLNSYLPFLEVNCGTPDNPRNGGVKAQTGTSYQETVAYECNSGFDLDGEAITVCLASGKWSTEPPTCNRMWNILIFI